MVLIILIEYDFKHVIEEIVFFVSLCDPCSRLQIRRLIFNPIWHSFQNDLLSECN